MLPTRIMHQPLSIADKVGVRGGDGKVVHRLWVSPQRNLFHGSPRASGRPDLLTEQEIRSRNPAAFSGEEGMFRGGGEIFAGDLEIDEYVKYLWFTHFHDDVIITAASTSITPK